jgi:hypothetical protein
MENNNKQMDINDLVVLKAAIEATKGNTKFKANKFYRCCEMDNNDKLVFGELFTKQEFDSLFETAHERVLRDWQALNLLGKDNKPLSKAAFLKLADIHTYGIGKKALKIWYFRNTRDCLYGFYPTQGNKVENLNECYEFYMDTIKGEMVHLDNEDIMFGNCGVPLVYGGLRVW